MTQVHRLTFETAKFVELKRRILEQYQDVDEVTLRDTLEGATNLRETLAALVRSALEDEAMCDGLKALVETMRTRLDRLEIRAINKRRAVLEAMETVDLAGFVEPDFTVSLRKTPSSVLIDDEDKIPRQFLVPQPPRLDRRGILAALAAGAAIPGAKLSVPRNSLSVRTL
jgi:hypothetical protein